jgi:hypothetical protein
MKKIFIFVFIYFIFTVKVFANVDFALDEEDNTFIENITKNIFLSIDEK